MTIWDGVTDFYEDDEPYAGVVAIASRPVDGVTARPISALDVAQEILVQTGPIDTWKLQKLCYYAQATHLALNGEVLFRDRIEAWAAGPVIRTLYREHRKKYQIADLTAGNAAHVQSHPTGPQTIRTVLARYGDLRGDQLSAMTHREWPWRQARGDLPPNASSDVEVSVEVMRDYYAWLETLPNDEQDEECLPFSPDES